MTIQDRGKYLRGLLLLIGKDQHVLDNERFWFYQLGKVLGYDKEFCEVIVRELPENEFLQTEPPQFSTPEIAKAFIIDGIHLAYADRELNAREMLWINAIAEKNGIDILWGMNEYEKFRHKKFTTKDVYKFEVEDIL